MSERPLSYSRPADILEMMNLRASSPSRKAAAKHRKAGGNAAEFEAFVARHRRELVSDDEAD